MERLVLSDASWIACIFLIICQFLEGEKFCSPCQLQREMSVVQAGAAAGHPVPVCLRCSSFSLAPAGTLSALVSTTFCSTGKTDAHFKQHCRTERWLLFAGMPSGCVCISHCFSLQLSGFSLFSLLLLPLAAAELCAAGEWRGSLDTLLLWAGRVSNRHHLQMLGDGEEGLSLPSCCGCNVAGLPCVGSSGCLPYTALLSGCPQHTDIFQSCKSSSCQLQWETGLTFPKLSKSQFHLQYALVHIT